jgi:hypothetical protein
MRQTRVLWLCLLFCCFCLFCRFAHADSIPGDPGIQVDDPTCPESGCQSVTAGSLFSFSSNAAGGGTTDFQLNGTVGFNTLDIETVGTFPMTSDVVCRSNAFGSCNVTFLDGVTDIYLSGCIIEGPCGIPADGRVFDIDLDNIVSANTAGAVCDNSTGICTTPDVGGWGANRSFSAIGGQNVADATTPFVSAPEPSSLFLLCTGAAAVALRRRIVKT